MERTTVTLRKQITSSLATMIARPQPIRPLRLVCREPPWGRRQPDHRCRPHRQCCRRNCRPLCPLARRPLDQHRRPSVHLPLQPPRRCRQLPMAFPRLLSLRGDQGLPMAWMQHWGRGLRRCWSESRRRSTLSPNSRPPKWPLLRRSLYCGRLRRSQALLSPAAIPLCEAIRRCCGDWHVVFLRFI